MGRRWGCTNEIEFVHVRGENVDNFSDGRLVQRTTAQA